VAGTGVAGYNQDAIPLRQAQLYWPQDIFVDPGGNIYILDWNNHRVRRANGLAGTITTVIGSGFLGDGATGPATSINLNHPTSLTMDGAGRLVLAAWHNWKIKRVNADGNVQVIAGTSQGFSGDGSAANQAQMDLPSSADYDAAGNLYISDQGNRRIRKVDPSGMMTTFAGTGVPGYNGDGLPAAEAQLNCPRGSDAVPAFKLAIDGNSLYLADTLNHRIRRIDLTTGIISTFAGTGTPGYSGDGGPAVQAALNFPTDVAIGPDHAVYVCDSRNHAVRKVTLQGTISTVAGTGVAGFSGDGPLATQAQLNTPGGIFVDRSGTLYIGDTLNNRVRMVTPQGS
jgi:sugar lactone lactonase YvrE